MRATPWCALVRAAARTFLPAVLGACATAPRAAAPAADAACIVASAPASGRVDVMLLEPVDPAHAPVPRNAAERLVFAQLYDTLVRLDCGGTVVPGLAESWSLLPDGSWVFRLRDDARFADGEPVTASAVLEAWGASAQAPSFAWVSAAGTRELRIAPAAPAPDARAFAHPSLAVARDVGDGWPVGTGAYRARTIDDGRTVLVRRTVIADAPDAIVLNRIDGDDPRAALDRGTDLLVTRDPAVVAYARARAGYEVARLPWALTYVLVSAAEGEAGTVPDSARAALALDVAVDGTRAAAHPRPDGLACDAGGASQRRAGARQPTIVYQQGDVVGRRVAERLTALAWPSGRAPAWLDALLADVPANRAPRALGLDSGALAQGMASAAHLAYVVATPFGTRTSCWPGLFDPVLRALQAGDGPAGHHVVPLLDAHDFLVWRSGIGVVRAEADGTVRIGGE